MVGLAEKLGFREAVRLRRSVWLGGVPRWARHGPVARGYCARPPCTGGPTSPSRTTSLSAENGSPHPPRPGRAPPPQSETHRGGSWPGPARRGGGHRSPPPRCTRRADGPEQLDPNLERGGQPQTSGSRKVESASIPRPTSTNEIGPAGGPLQRVSRSPGGVADRAAANPKGKSTEDAALSPRRTSPGRIRSDPDRPPRSRRAAP